MFPFGIFRSLAPQFPMASSLLPPMLPDSANPISTLARLSHASSAVNVTSPQSPKGSPSPVVTPPAAPAPAAPASPSSSASSASSKSASEIKVTTASTTSEEQQALDLYTEAKGKHAALRDCESLLEKAKGLLDKARVEARALRDLIEGGLNYIGVMKNVPDLEHWRVGTMDEYALKIQSVKQQVMQAAQGKDLGEFKVFVDHVLHKLEIRYTCWQDVRNRESVLREMLSDKKAIDVKEVNRQFDEIHNALTTNVAAYNACHELREIANKSQTDLGTALSKKYYESLQKQLADLTPAVTTFNNVTTVEDYNTLVNSLRETIMRIMDAARQEKAGVLYEREATSKISERCSELRGKLERHLKSHQCGVTSFGPQTFSTSFGLMTVEDGKPLRRKDNDLIINGDAQKAVLSVSGDGALWIEVGDQTKQVVVASNRTVVIAGEGKMLPPVHIHKTPEGHVVLSALIKDRRWYVGPDRSGVLHATFETCRHHFLESNAMGVDQCLSSLSPPLESHVQIRCKGTNLGFDLGDDDGLRLVPLQEGSDVPFFILRGIEGSSYLTIKGRAFFINDDDHEVHLADDPIDTVERENLRHFVQVLVKDRQNPYKAILAVPSSQASILMHDGKLHVVKYIPQCDDLFMDLTYRDTPTEEPVRCGTATTFANQRFVLKSAAGFLTLTPDTSIHPSRRQVFQTDSNGHLQTEEGEPIFDEATKGIPIMVRAFDDGKLLVLVHTDHPSFPLYLTTTGQWDALTRDCARYLWTMDTRIDCLSGVEKAILPSYDGRRFRLQKDTIYLTLRKTSSTNAYTMIGGGEEEATTFRIMKDPQGNEALLLAELGDPPRLSYLGGIRDQETKVEVRADIPDRSAVLKLRTKQGTDAEAIVVMTLDDNVAAIAYDEYDAMKLKVIGHGVDCRDFVFTIVPLGCVPKAEKVDPALLPDDFSVMGADGAFLTSDGESLYKEGIFYEKTMEGKHEFVSVDHQGLAPVPVRDTEAGMTLDNGKPIRKEAVTDDMMSLRRLYGFTSAPPLYRLTDGEGGMYSWKDNRWDFMPRARFHFKDGSLSISDKSLHSTLGVGQPMVVFKTSVEDSVGRMRPQIMIGQGTIMLSSFAESSTGKVQTQVWNADDRQCIPLLFWLYPYERRTQAQPVCGEPHHVLPSEKRPGTPFYLSFFADKKEWWLCRDGEGYLWFDSSNGRKPILLKYDDIGRLSAHDQADLKLGIEGGYVKLLPKSKLLLRVYAVSRPGKDERVMIANVKRKEYCQASWSMRYQKYYLAAVENEQCDDDRMLFKLHWT